MCGLPSEHDSLPWDSPAPIVPYHSLARHVRSRSIPLLRSNPTFRTTELFSYTAYRRSGPVALTSQTRHPRVPYTTLRSWPTVRLTVPSPRTVYRNTTPVPQEFSPITKEIYWYLPTTKGLAVFPHRLCRFCWHGCPAAIMPRASAGRLPGSLSRGCRGRR